MSDARLRSLPLRLLRRLRPPRRLKFTREGRYFVAITIGIGLAAINTGNNLLYLLLGWLLSVILASGALSDVSLRGLHVARRAPPRIYANRPFLMQISVDNLKGKLSSYSVETEDIVDGKPLDKKCYFLKVPPGRTQQTAYRHTFPRRGLYQFDGFRISTKFPFALFHKSRDVRAPGEILVYPAVHPVAIPPPRSRHFGETPLARLGRRGEFFGLREYRDGDDRRDIHWRNSARGGRLLVREYEEEAQTRVTLLLDNGVAATADAAVAQALEEAISLAASLASGYLGAGYAVRMITRGEMIPFGFGRIHRARILKALALLEPAPITARFAGRAEPFGENVLVAPRGSAGPRPGNVSRVMEAG